jgi:diaminopimelate decarboxylase
MDYFKSEYFPYRLNQLHCEEVPVKDIIEKTGTPVYIYSKKFFIDRFNELNNAFKEIEHRVFYSVKANFNLNVIKIFIQSGAGVDVNSEGELFRALKAGADPRNTILAGVGKTADEIKLGIEKDLLMIKAESPEEIYLIDEIAGRLNKTARVAIRVNPDVDPQTHPYVSTSLSENKFGIDSLSANKLFRTPFKNLKFTGIDMHLGSQITTVSPFAEAVDKLSQLFFELKADGIHLEHFDIGGGVGVKYNNESNFSISEYAKVLIPKLKKLNCKVFFEPGRFLTANGGIVVTKVLYNKKNNLKKFAIVDAAMNDLLRPSIYKSYHHVQPVELDRNREDIKADIAGPICESGDFFAKDRIISETKPGEYLAIMSTGAYGMVMTSNYNARRRPPEIIVDGNKFYITRSRESYDHLLYDEKVINEI